jgi:G3E family GTPase
MQRCMQVSELAGSQLYDYLLIESTGISEPLPVAQTFAFADSQGRRLDEVAMIDTMVTVVDSEALLPALMSLETLQQIRGGGAHMNDTRSLAQLMVDQLEFANVVVLNKMDRVTSVEAAALDALVRRLNARCRVIRTTRCDVDVSDVVGTGLFDMATESQSERWLAELSSVHTPETDEYGISSFVYRSSRPFHPVRLHELLSCFGKAPLSELSCIAPASDAAVVVSELPPPAASPLRSVVRSKGFVWLANANGRKIDWQSVGERVQLDAAEPFLAAVPQDCWTDPERAEAQRLSASAGFEWDPRFGDRRTELVLIGVRMQHAAARLALDSACLHESEMDEYPNSWRKLPDPFFGGQARCVCTAHRAMRLACGFPARCTLPLHAGSRCVLHRRAVRPSSPGCAGRCGRVPVAGLAPWMLPGLRCAIDVSFHRTSCTCLGRWPRRRMPCVRLLN